MEVVKTALCRSGTGLSRRAFVQRFCCDRRGSTLAMMAAGLFPMIGSLGAAIDLGRIYIASSQMQAGADAAALAGANAFDNTNNNDPNGRYQQVISYFRDNYPDEYMGIEAGGGTPPIGGTQTLLEP